MFFLLSLAAASILYAQSGRGEDLTIKIAVAGPGDELYFSWGHIALIIENVRSGEDRFYDYGLFSLETENFYTNFAMGRMWYSSGASPTANSVNIYIYTNREMTIYTLDLPPAKREAVRDYAENSILPENRDYLYHVFKENCSHPILEMIDLATDGQFRERFRNMPGRFTLRQHVRRHTWFAPFPDWLLCFLMGQGIDLPITVWDEMFLPSEVARNIQNFSYTDSDGISRPLVSNVEVLYKAQNRPPVLDTPVVQWPRELAFSLVLSLALCGLFFIQAKFPALGQVTLGICHSLFGVVFGVAGLLLFFMGTFTEHDYTFHNINILFCNPLMLAAIPLGIQYARADNYNKRLRPELLLRLLWLLTVLGVFVSMLLKLSPRFWQDNLTDQMLMLPIALTLAFEPAGLRRMIRRLFWRWF